MPEGSGGLQEPCPSPGRRSGVGAPLVTPRSFRGADFWAETATFWEATHGSTGHEAPRSPTMGETEAGEGVTLLPLRRSPVYCRTYSKAVSGREHSWAAAGARVGKLRQGDPLFSITPTPNPRSCHWHVLGENDAKSGKTHIYPPPRAAPHFPLLAWLNAQHPQPSLGAPQSSQSSQ